jgi:hypothetical protein
VIVSIEITPRSVLPAFSGFSFGEVTVGDSKNMVGYYLELISEGQVIDTTCWERQSTVDRLKEEHKLPTQWWK